MLDWAQMDLERYLEIQMNWDFVNEKDIERIPFFTKTKHGGRNCIKIKKAFRRRIGRGNVIYCKKRNKNPSSRYESRLREKIGISFLDNNLKSNH